MSLIRCRVCGHSLSVNARTCPLCGEPDPSGREASNKRLGRMLGVIVVLAAVGVLYFWALPIIQHSPLFNHLRQGQ